METEKQPDSSALPLDPEKTYVYDGIEVILTKRMATQEKKMSSGKILKNVLVEVTPIKKPGVPVWRKWVKPKDLFEVAAEPMESLDKLMEK